MSGAERTRVESFGHPEDGLRQATPWYQWGPYLSERAWGTVREDYSAGGDAWDYFPHDHARSRAYRWGEDGMAGVSDVEQQLCMALALWNGRDPILKERMFGLTGPQGNHGEDVKEYWWFLDAVPSHAWLRWRYHYPQAEFPYADLVAENGRRDHSQPEYELLDTGVFDEDRYWVVDVTHAKDDPHDLLMEIRVTNAGPETSTLHVLPHLWFRNTWSWDVDAERPTLAATGPDQVRVDHPRFGELTWELDTGPDGATPELLFCDNDTNLRKLYQSPDSPAYPKDGVNDHVVTGAATVNPDGLGTKAAGWYRLTVAAGETQVVRVRLRPPSSAPAFGQPFDAVLARRSDEADEFYDEVIPASVDDDARLVARQAFAGMLWSKQFYYYDVKRWLDGDPTQPPPPPERRQGRNAGWLNVDARDILSMPDPWEYPWFAAWDLAFHTVALAHVDPAFAKYQLLAMCREWFQNPNGALPAYEWAFGDTNPPVHAWAALHVWDIDGRRDTDFLARLMPKLLMNFTWWVNRMDPEGDHLFAGGFLGLDNISAIDRSHLPPGGRLEQADGTSWMAFYSLTLLEMARILATEDDTWTDIEVKFIEHFVLIVDAMHSQGLWDEEDGFFYDVFHAADGTTTPIKVRSIVGVLPLMGTVALGPDLLETLGTLRKRFARFLRQAEGDIADGGRVFPIRGHRCARDRRRTPGRRAPRAVARVRRERVPLAVRAAGRVEVPRGPPPLGRTRRSPCLRRLRARRVVHRHVRRQLQLEGPGLDARELPPAPQPPALRRIRGRRRLLRVPDRERRAARPHRLRRRSAGPADLPLPARPRRAPPVLRVGRPTPERPPMARQHHLQRVLPRRQRSRTRRHPPDRLDRARGRPDLQAGPVRGRRSAVAAVTTSLRVELGHEVT